jgi:arsenate reductase
MSDTVLYHNPRCSKSRAALQLLNECGVQPTILRYLEQPPDADRIRAVLRLLGLPARALLRKSEAEYSALNLGDPALDDDALVSAMASHPILIERPLFVHKGRAVIGRPPERVLELLG